MSGKTVRPETCRLWIQLLALATALLWKPVWAQEPPKAQESPNGPVQIEPVNRETLEAKLKQAEESKELNDDAKAKVRDLYQQALPDLDTISTLSSQEVVYEEMAANVPEKIQAAKATLAEKPAEAAPVVPANATLADLEQLLTQQEAELSKAKLEVQRIDAEPARRSSRKTEIPNQIAALRQQLSDLEQQLAAPPPADEAPPLTAARQLRGPVRRRALEQEITTYEKELAGYAAATDLLLVQRDLAARQATRAETVVSKLREIVNVRRQQEVERVADAARLEAARAHPLLQPEATRSHTLAESSKKLVPQFQDLSQDLDETTQALERVKDDFKTVQEKVDTAGLTEGIGLLLRRQLSSLPDVRRFRRNLQRRRVELRATQLLLLDLDDERYALSDTEREAKRKLAQLGPLPSDVDADGLQRALRGLLETRRDLLGKLIGSYDSYFDLLVRYDSLETSLINEVLAYQEYLRERVLWIRKARVLQPSDVHPAGEAVVWLLRPDNWIDAGWAAIPYGQRVQILRAEDPTASWSDIASAVGTEITKRPLPLVGSLLFVGYFVVLTVNQRRLRKRIKDLGVQAARRNCQHIRPTFQVLFDTVLASLLWPSLLLFVAWRLTTAFMPSDFVRAVGYGMAATGTYYLSFEFVRQICRPAGLAEAHFDWPEVTISAVRRTLGVLLVVSTPFVFIVISLHGQSNESWQNSLARMCYVGASIFVGWLVHRLFRPSGRFFQGLATTAPEGWFYRLRRFWYASSMFSLISLVVLALIGYYYTAYELAFRLQETLWLLLSLALFASIVLRWLLVSRRRLRIQQALERRREAVAQADAGEQATTPASHADVPETEMDLGEMSEQSRRLLHVSLFVAGFLGLWGIWADVLPALGILERVKLWQLSETEWITIEQLVVCFVLLGLTFLAIKNIPGLLELTILQRLPIDAGARYAITTCFRYVITVIGLISAFRTIGIEWSQYQWLVAAAGVGLGFGMQEIFANFVSGLIVLMERPVKVGDIVTVEGVTGVVSRIRMRATTVMNWDRQEFIVPNKDFVTGRLLNWTLSNAVNRVMVNVGVAYGADTDQAEELLLRIATENPNILDDPAPLATLEGFGDSTLNFVLRCYLPNLDNRLATIHAMHAEIHRRFAEAGIEIAFPQRDIHIRSVMPPFVVDERRGEEPPKPDHA